MKKTLLLFTLFFVLSGIIGSILFKSRDTVPAPSVNQVLGSIVEEKPIETEKVGEPLTLVIPSLNVNAQVENVGYAPDRRMDVPKAPENVGWWMLGPKPGETGSSVLAGHFDAPDGSPAVFYDLTSLTPGDFVQVKDSKGKTRDFVVTKVDTYKDANFPLDTVFSQTEEKRLNLITCSGTFDQLENNYSDRLVVFTKLKE